MARKLKVNLQMALASSSTMNGYWRIEVTDQLSRVVIASLSIPPEVFGRALGAQYQTDVDAEVPDAEAMALIGLRHESRTVRVPVGNAWGEECLEIVRSKRADYEVDGWAMRDYDVGQDRFNSHRRNGSHDNGYYSISMSRWVDPSTPEYVDPPVLPESAPEKTTKNPKGKSKKAKANKS